MRARRARRVVAVVLGLLLATALRAGADGEGEGPKSPLAAGTTHPALEGLGARISRVGDAKPADPPPSRFKPSGTRLLIGTLVEAVAEDPAQRKALREVVDAVLTAYEAEAAKAGIANDVAAALAFFLSAHYGAAHDGAEVPDAAVETLVRQLQVALDVPALRSAPDAERQQLYELFTFLAIVTMVRLQAAVESGDADGKAAARAAGEEGLRAILGVEPGRVTLAGKEGLRIRPAASAPPAAPAPGLRPAAPAAAGAARLTWTTPPGWAETRKDDGSVWVSRSDGDDFYGRSTCVVILLPAGPAAPDPVAGLRSAWASTIASSFDGTTPLFPLRRRVNGANSAFAYDFMTLRSNGARFDVWLHVIDLGAAAATVGVLLQGDQTLYLEAVESLLASLRAGAAPAPAALFTPSEIVGTWTWSSHSIADFVSPSGQYAGDASLAVGETFTFRQDGTYSLQFGGVGRGKVVRGDEKGRFRIDGDRLVLLPDGEEARASRRRLLGVGPGDDGKGRVLLLMEEAYDLRPANIRFYGQRFKER